MSDITVEEVQAMQARAEKADSIPEWVEVAIDLPRLAASWLEQREELERLKAVVARLPKTADGMPMFPGQMCWRVVTATGQPMLMQWKVSADNFADYVVENKDSTILYSTRESAALAASASPPKSGGGEGC